MHQDVAMQQSLAGNFYREHHSWLNNWLRKKLGCGFDAADLAQDTFVKVVSHGKLDTVQEPRAFLTTIASRLIIDLIRKRNIEAAYLEALALANSDSACASPEQIREAVETLNEIAAILEGLPEKVYRAFLMFRLDGLSYAEIAEALGVSSSMVKQYLARAMHHCYQLRYA